MPGDSFSFWAQAAVAAFCIGSCVGNVFVFRRFVAGYRFRADVSAAQPRADRTRTEPRPGRRADPSRGPRRPSEEALPPGVLDDLRVLGLPASRPRPADVKEAYRRVALECHPDRLAPEDPRRPEKTRRFDAATVAYRRLLRLLDRGPAD